jgi:hypothetical protein
VFDDVDFEDYSTAEENLEALIEERLDELALTLGRDHIEKLVRSYGVHWEHEIYHRPKLRPQHRSIEPTRSQNEDQAIDDLFEQT